MLVGQPQHPSLVQMTLVFIIHVAIQARAHCQCRHSCRQMLHKAEQKPPHALETSNHRLGALLALGCLMQGVTKNLFIHVFSYLERQGEA